MTPARRPRREALRINFTAKALEAIKPAGDRRVVYHDTNAHANGLCLRVEASGQKRFCWFRKVNGRPTWKLIGQFPDLSIENARAAAAKHNKDLADWKAREYEGENPFEARRRDLTLKTVLEDYCERHLRTEAKNPTRAMKGARWQFEKYASAWKERRLGSVHKRDVLDLQKRVRDKHGLFTSNRLVQLLRALYNWASEHMDWKGENVARVKLFSERPSERTRFLRAEELASLFAALRDEPSRDLRDFTVLALFTGARMGDVLSARWENITFDPPAWEIPNPKNRVPYIVPLMTEAVEVLKDRRARAGDSPWVFPGSGRTGHVTGFKNSWKKLLTRAKLTNLRVHDLRRTFGSWQAALGGSTIVIGKSLGHQSPGSTQIYSRLDLDPVRQSVERATQAMTNAIKALPQSGTT